MGLTENIPFSLLHIHHIVTLMMRCRLALCRCRYCHYCRCSAPTSRSEHWFKTTFYVYKNSVSPLRPRASSGHPPPARPIILKNSHQQHHPMGALSLCRRLSPSLSPTLLCTTTTRVPILSTTHAGWLTGWPPPSAAYRRRHFSWGTHDTQRGEKCLCYWKGNERFGKL